MPTPNRLPLEQLRIYVTSAPNPHTQERISWWQDPFGLRVYGDSLLGTRARIEMRYAALLLTVIFIFDLITWTALWNMVFHSGNQRLDLVTLLAVVGGLLFAGAIFIYERQFITADVSSSWWQSFKTLGAVAIRLVVIGVAAFITSQPVEVLVFKGQIEKRIHEESIAARAVQYLDDLRPKRKSETTAAPQQVPSSANEDSDVDETLTSLEIEQLDKHRKDVDAAGNDRISALALRARLQRTIAANNAAIARLTRLRNQAKEQNSKDSYQRRIDGVNAAKSGNETRLRETELAIEKAEIREKELGQSTIIADANKKLQAPVERRQMLKKLLDEFSNAPPNTSVRSSDSSIVLTDVPYDFFERLRILEDLKAGNPSQLPVDRKLKPEEREYLATTLRVPGFNNEDEQAKGLRELNARIFRFQYDVVFYIALVIPLLVLAFKFLIAKELSSYYSSEMQAEAGNYEALRVTRTNPKVSELRAGFYTNPALEPPGD